MANSVLLKRSSTENKRPVAASMLNGELDLNYSDISGGIFYKNASGSVVKVGPAQVGTTAPNSTPAGSAGNSVGEFWFDTSVSSLKLWDGSAWQTCGALTYPGTTSYTPVSYVQWPTPANPTDRVAVEGDVTALFSAGQLIAFPDVSGVTQYTLQSTQYLSGSDATAFTFAVNPAPATTYSGPLLITAATQYAVKGVNAGTGISLSFDPLSDSLTITNAGLPISWIPNNTAPTTANNGDFWLNTTNGPFALQQRVNGAWVANDTTGAIINNIISTAVSSVPSPTPYDVFFGLGGDGAYAASIPINDIIFATNYTVTSSFNKITNVVTFTFTNTTGNTDDGTLLTSFVVGEKYSFVMSGDNEVDWVITSTDSAATAPFPVTVTARIADQAAISDSVALLAAVSGATVTDYEITGLGKNIFNGAISFNPAIRGVLAPASSLTGSFLYWSAPSNPPGGPYFVPEWSLVSIADMIQAGTGIGITYDDRFGTYTITNTAAAASTPGGPTGAIQFNNAGVFGGEADFIWDSANNWVRVPAIYGAVDSLTIGATTSGGGAGGLLSLAGGNATANAGQTGGGVSIFAGGGGAGGTGGSVTIRAASTGGSTGNGGDITITGGTGQGATFTSGNVVIAPGSVATGATSGTVQISGISAASATATYTPTAATDLATKAYVDAAADGGVAGANTQVQFNNNGAFGASSNLTFTAAAGGNPSYLSLQKVQGFDTQGLTVQAGVSGGVSVLAGDGDGVTPNGGDVTITPGAAGSGGLAGSVNITNISIGQTKAGYTPLTANSLTDKAYVDGLTNPVAWIPNNTAPTTANNGDFWLNTTQGPFALQQRISGAWATNDTTGAIVNNVISTAVNSVPYPTLYDIIGVGGSGGYNVSTALNDIIFATNYTVTSSFNKITNVVTFTFTNTTGNTDLGTLLSGFVVGEKYIFQMANDNEIDWVITSRANGNTAPFPVTFTARIADQTDISYAVSVLAAVSGATVTDYEITGLGKNIFNGVSGIDPAVRGVLAPNSSTTGSFLYWTAPSNPPGGPYAIPRWKLVGIADMIQAGAGIGVTYDDQGGAYTITNSNPGPSYNVNTPLIPTVLATPGDGTFTNSGDSSGVYTLGLVIIFTGDPSYTRYTVTGSTYNPGDLTTTTSVTPNWSTSGFTPATNATTSSTTVAPIAFLNPGNNITFDYYTLQDAITINATTQTTPAAGANTQVQYNNNGAFGAEADFAYVAGTNTLTVGNITGTAANFSLVTPAQATAEANGYNITIAPGDGGTGQGVGGVLTLRGGGGTYGGDVNITGAVSSVAAGFSGSVYINGGAPGTATAEGGTVEIRGSATVNLVNGTAGNLTLAGGSVIGAGGAGGDTYVSGGNAADPGGLILFGGSSTVTGGTGGDVTITGGLIASGTGTSGTGGNIVISGGTGAGVTNVVGGSVSIAGGAGAGTGNRGGVSITDITGASAKASYTPSANTDLTTKSYVDGKFVPGGTNGQVQFNFNGAFGGDAGLVYDYQSDTLTLPSIVSGNATLSLTAGTQTATNSAGHDISVIAGAGNGSGAGGALTLTAGSSSGSGPAKGGQVTLSGGNGTGTNNTPGGDVVISGGSGIGTGADGNVYITDIVEANAKASYVPTATGDLTTKSYVDQFSAGNNRFYGEFSSTLDQANQGGGLANLVTYNTTIHSNGVTVANGSRLTTANAGVYNIQFSVQWAKTDSGIDTVYLWFRKNGVDVDNSNSSWALTGNGDRIVGSLNYVNTFNANDYIELVWWAADVNLSMAADPAAAAVSGVSPALPAIPSVIVTVVPV